MNYRTTGLMRMRLRNWLITEMPGHLPGSVALRVPSALSPVEFNYLLNPEHPEFYGIVQKAQIAFRFDVVLNLTGSENKERALS